MKNRKGFTLIEIIVTVIILGIILIIAVPTVTKYINKGKNSYYTSLEREIKTSGIDYLETYRTLLPRKVGHVKVISLNELVDNKYLDPVKDEEGNNCIGQITVEKVKNDSYKYYSCIKCGHYDELQDNGETYGKYYSSSLQNCSYSETNNVYEDSSEYRIAIRNVEVDETKGYKKTVVDGITTYEVPHGEKFTLPTAIVYHTTAEGEKVVDDNLEGLPNVIDENELTNYKEIIYYYHGAKEKIVVKVLDKTSPSIPQIVLKYDNEKGNNYNYKWTNKNLYAEFKSTDYTKKGLLGIGVDYYEISFNEGASYEKIDGNSYIHNEVGERTIYVRSVDKAGNKSEANRYIIKIDNQAPVCRLVASGKQGNEGWFTDDVTVTYDEGDTSGTGSNILIRLNIPKITESVKNKVVIGTVTDEAGNTSTCRIVVNMDKDIPETPTIIASDNKLTNTWHNQDFSLELNSRENVSGNIYLTREDTEIAKQSDGIVGKTKNWSSEIEEKKVYAMVCSRAGLCSNNSNYIIKLDKTKPDCVITGEPNPVAWTENNRTITYGCSDALSKCNINYSGGSTTYSNTTKTATIAAYTIKDNAGNTRNCSASEVIVYVDKTNPSKPTIDNNKNNKWTNEDITLQIDSHDHVSTTYEQSGVIKYQFSYNKTTWEDYENSTPVISNEQDNTVYIRSCDEVGNCSDEESTIIKIDKTKPSKPIIINPTNGEFTNENFKLTLKSTDTGAANNANSGISYYQYKYVNTNWTTYENSATTEFTTPEFSKERNEEVFIRACDRAGNCSDEESTYIRIDKTLPTCSLRVKTGTSGENGWYKSDVTLEFASTDGTGSDIKTSIISPNPMTQTGTAIGTVTDDAGNTNTCSIDIKIDKVAPECTNDGDSISWTKNNRTIKYGCSDDNSLCNFTDGEVQFTTTTKTATIASYEIKDFAGNTKTCPARTANVYVDKTKPVLESITNPTNGDWTKTDFALTLKSNDEDGTEYKQSGIAYYQYKYANTSWQTYDNSNKETFTTTNFSTARNEEVYIRVCDAVGNCSDQQSTYIRIDKTEPVCGTLNGTSTSWIKENRIITSTCTDGASNCFIKNKTDEPKDTYREEISTTTKKKDVSFVIIDSAGNEKTCTYNDVNIYVDKTNPQAPTITNSSNGNWTNQDITLTITSNDKVGTTYEQSEIVKYQYSFDTGTNKTYTDYANSSGNSFTAPKYTDSMDKTIYIRACDNVGNCSSPSSTDLKIDKVKPSCEIEIKEGILGENNWYVSDVTFKAKAQSSSVGSPIKSETFKNNIKTLSSSGTVYLTVEDEAGNKKDCEMSVNIDQTPPTCTNSADYTSWTKENRTVTYGCNDTGSLCNFTDGEVQFTTTTKTATIPSYEIKDNAGNKKTCPARTAYVYVDKTAPEKPSITNPTNGNWTNESFKLTLSSNDKVDTTYEQSGVAKYQYSYDDKNFTDYANSSGNSFITTDFSTERDQYVYIKACDSVGNCSESAKTMIRIDKTKPICGSLTGDSTSWTSGNRTVSITCSDNDSTCVNETLSREFTSTNKVEPTISFEIEDEAGNTRTCTYNNVNIYIDKTAPAAPTITNPSNGNWTNEDIELTVTSNDKVGTTYAQSGIAKYMYSYDNHVFEDYPNSSGNSFTPPKFTETMEKTIYIKACDSVGNCSSANSTNLKIDKTEASCELVVKGNPKGENGWYREDVEVEFASLATGVTAVGIDKTKFTSSGTATGTVQNRAGVQKTCTLDINIDKVAPSCTSSGDSTSWTKENRTITYGCSESSGSGCNFIDGEVVINTTTKTTTIPSYEIRDLAGNTKTCPARTANVYVDKTAPAVPTITNAAGCNYTSDDITLTMTSNDQVNTTYTQSGIVKYQYSYDTGTNKSYTDFTNSSGNSFTAPKYTNSMDKTINIRACDSVGNCSNPSNTCLKIDKTEATCSLVVKSGTLGENGWYKSNVEVEFAPLADGVTAVGIDKTSFTSSGKATGTVQNKAGVQKTCTLDIKIDKVAPECTVSGESTNWTKENRTITYGCSDSGSLCNTNYSGSSKTFDYTTPNGIGEIPAYTIKDNAGNTTNCAKRNVNAYVDKTAPAVPTITNPTNGNWTKEDFSLTLNSNDKVGTSPKSQSGIGYYQYKYADTSWKTYSDSAMDEFTTTPFSKERNEEVYIRACDNVGNCSEASSTYIKIDKTEPVCGTLSGTSSSWTKENRVITSECSDLSSNCYVVGKTDEPKNLYREEINATTKTKNVSFTITDGAGNTKTCSYPNSNIYVDKTAPATPTITNAAGCSYTSDDITLTMTSNDQVDTTYAQSGIVKYQYSYDTGTNKSYTDFSNSSGNSFTAPKYTESMNKTIYIRACDSVGNCSNDANTCLKIDKTEAACTLRVKQTTGLVVGENGWYRSNVEVEFAPLADDVTAVGINKTSFTASGTATGTVQNKAGVQKTCTLDIKIDKDNPQCTFSGESTAWTKDDRTITATCNDAISLCTTETSSNSWSYTSGAHKTENLSYTIKDNAGNQTTCSTTANVYVDKVAPSVPTITNSANGSWTKNSISLTLASTDNVTTDFVQSNSVYYEYSFDTGTNKTWSNLSSTTFSDDQNRTIYIRACDSVGNCSDSSSTDLKTDSTLPIISYSLEGGIYNANKTVTVTITESNLKRSDVNVYKNGVKQTAKSTNNSTSKSFTISLDSDAVWKISTTASDQANNSVTVEKEYIIDTVAPVISYDVAGLPSNITGSSDLPRGYYNSNTVPSGVYGVNKTITITVNDNNFNYMNVKTHKNVTLQNEYNNVTTSTKTVTLNSEGDWLVSTQAWDKTNKTQTQSPDNGAGYYYQRYIIDKSGPTITASGPTNHVVTISATDSITSIKKMQYEVYLNNVLQSSNDNLQADSFNVTLSNSGTWKIRVKAEDIVENWSNSNTWQEFTYSLNLCSEGMRKVVTNSYYGDCDKSCGGGRSYLYEDYTLYSTYGDEVCQTVNGEQTSTYQECNMQSCCTEPDEKVWTFNYKNEVQTFTVPYDGIYQLEVWGAQGGNGNGGPAPESSNGTGGLGGYSQGEVKLKAGEVLNVVVGEFPDTLQREAFNGGGFGSGVSAGGGATHIAKQYGSYGLLSSYDEVGTESEKAIAKNNILIVAGGGGGGAHCYICSTLTNGGTGGGTNGGNGSGQYYGRGGTQFAGGQYVDGDDSKSSENGFFGKGSGACTGGGGGGGGWYGGSGGCWGGWYSQYKNGSGGGGSGYTGGVDNSSTENGVRSGHGLAKITLLTNVCDYQTTEVCTENQVLYDNSNGLYFYQGFYENGYVFGIPDGTDYYTTYKVDTDKYRSVTVTYKVDEFSSTDSGSTCNPTIEFLLKEGSIPFSLARRSWYVCGGYTYDWYYGPTGYNSGTGDGCKAGDIGYGDTCYRDMTNSTVTGTFSFPYQQGIQTLSFYIGGGAWRPKVTARVYKIQLNCN